MGSILNVRQDWDGRQKKTFMNKAVMKMKWRNETGSNSKYKDAELDSVHWISGIQLRHGDKEQPPTFLRNQSHHCLFKDNIMSVLLIYMSANLISAVMNLTLKAYTVSWKQVVVMNHQCNPSKGFFFQYRIGIVPVEKAVAKCYLKSSERE